MSPRVLGLASAGVGPRPTYSIICVAGGDVYSILYVVDFAVTGLEIPVEIALPSLNLRPPLGHLYVPRRVPSSGLTWSIQRQLSVSYVSVLGGLLEI